MTRERETPTRKEYVKL